MRLSDAGLKASMFFQDPIMGQVETGLPPNDPRVPTIKSMTKNEEASARTREVVKAIDFFNQSVPVQKRPNQFIGERPSPSDILGREISRKEEVTRFNWKNFPPQSISVLEDLGLDLVKEGYHTLGAYTPESKRIEWRKPINDKEKTAIAHEQLHRFIYEHPAGKPFKHLKGDHELFVRTYTHLLNGGELTDPELAEDLLDARGNYKDINIDRFAKNARNYINAFESAVLTHSTGVEQATVVDGAVVVTAPRIERQMEQLLSSNKREVRAIRNNNPFNLKYTEIKWDGKLPLDKETEDTFERFDSNLMGMRAGVINTLTHHIKYGDDTIEKLITRYAPPDENDTENIITFVSKNMGIERNQKIDLKNKEVFYEYAKAVVTMEGFKSDELDSLIYDAIELGYKQKKIK